MSMPLRWPPRVDSPEWMEAMNKIGNESFSLPPGQTCASLATFIEEVRAAAVAAEVIQDTNRKWYVSRAGWGKGCVYLTPFTWQDAPKTSPSQKNL